MRAIRWLSGSCMIASSIACWSSVSRSDASGGGFFSSFEGNSSALGSDWSGTNACRLDRRNSLKTRLRVIFSNQVVNFARGTYRRALFQTRIKTCCAISSTSELLPSMRATVPATRLWCFSMSSSNAPVSPPLTNCMSRTSSASSSDLPTVPRSLPDIGHLDVCIERNLLRIWHAAEICSFTFVAMVFVASWKSSVHSWLPASLNPGLRMNYLLIPKELRPIAEKVEASQRISEADALNLYRSNDLNALGIIASVVRERKNGNYASYIHNRYINYSNICVLSCQFCAFAAKKRDAHAFEYASDEIIRAVAEALPLGITEVHMVGGLHPTLKTDWYLDLLRGLRALDRDLHIKAFTAIEVRHLAKRIFRMSIQDTLELLRDCGLGSITGGGAEIFDPVVRNQICRGKETAEEWLASHRTLRRIGGRSTCTMLYGHIETLLTASIICVTSVNCRMKPAVLPGSSLLLSNRRRLS